MGASLKLLIMRISNFHIKIKAELAQRRKMNSKKAKKLRKSVYGLEKTQLTELKKQFPFDKEIQQRKVVKPPITYGKKANGVIVCMGKRAMYKRAKKTL